AQQERQAAGVVLVAVGENAALHSLGVLAQPREVGQHQVDAGHLDVGEHEPAIEEHEAVVDLDHRAVAADLTEAAEEGDSYWASQDGRARPGRGPRDLREPARWGDGTRPPGCRARASSPSPAP